MHLLSPPSLGAVEIYLFNLVTMVVLLFDFKHSVYILWFLDGHYIFPSAVIVDILIFLTLVLL